MTVSVVIPTYNRGAKLRATIESLLANETQGEKVEIIVVDDGSPQPAEPVIAQCRTRAGFELRPLRQANAGPAAARNTGFRAARGELVLFIDDDIIAPPDLIRRHIAAHQVHPGAVIFGLAELVTPPAPTPAFRYISTLRPAPDDAEFIRSEIVASGHLSVERGMFEASEGVYRDDLSTPGAEEFELSLRLGGRGIPIYFAPMITALHDQPVTIEMLCRQQFKHARGIAEVATKYPATLDLPSLRHVIDVNDGDDGPPALRLKRTLKRPLASEPARAALLRGVKAAERFGVGDRLLAPLYRAVIGLHFFAGVRAGRREYGDGGGLAVEAAGASGD